MSSSYRPLTRVTHITTDIKVLGSLLAASPTEGTSRELHIWRHAVETKALELKEDIQYLCDASSDEEVELYEKARRIRKAMMAHRLVCGTLDEAIKAMLVIIGKGRRGFMDIV